MNDSTLMAMAERFLSALKHCQLLQMRVAQADGDAAAWRSVLDGVADEVIHRLAQLRRIAQRRAPEDAQAALVP